MQANSQKKRIEGRGEMHKAIIEDDITFHHIRIISKNMQQSRAVHLFLMFLIICVVNFAPLVRIE